MRTNEQITQVYSQLYRSIKPHLRNPETKIVEMASKILYEKIEKDCRERMEDLELDELKSIMLLCEKGEKAVVGTKESSPKGQKEGSQEEVSGSLSGS